MLTGTKKAAWMAEYNKRPEVQARAKARREGTYIRRPSKSPGIEELKAEARPGVCIICDGPIPPPKNPYRLYKKRTICPDVDCEKTWHQIYDVDFRAARNAATKRWRARKKLELKAGGIAA